MKEAIKKIREMTGAGVVDIKKALEEAGNDEQKAIEILRAKGLEKAAKKGGREAKEGLVASYVHSNGRLASLVKLYCETDFVARNQDFQSLAKDIAMHVAAMNPAVVRPEDVSADEIEKQKEDWKKQLQAEGKPEKIWDTIIKGKEEKLRKEQALLTQPFIKDQERTVEDVIKEKVAVIGENIQVGEFVRMEL